MASPSTFSLAVKVWETVAPQVSWPVSHGCLTEKAAVASFIVIPGSPCSQTTVFESSGRVEAGVGRGAPAVLGQLPRGSGISGSHCICPPRDEAGRYLLPLRSVVSAPSNLLNCVLHLSPS